MANVAAHLVDRVLPAVPMRQSVLSLPFELRTLAAFRADVLSGVGRIFIEAVFARYHAIVPPPRYPLLRYAGVLGPRSAWRRDLVPRPPQQKPCDASPATKEPTAQPRPKAESSAEPVRTPGTGTATRATKSTPTEAPAPLRAIDDSVDAGAAGNWYLLTPNVLSVKHWNRLLGGALYAASPRVDWASLLRRSFDVDVLACSSCGGRLRVLGEITEPAMIRLVLDALGMPTEAPRPRPGPDGVGWRAPGRVDSSPPRGRATCVLEALNWVVPA
jgi:hypothetical protein